MGSFVTNTLATTNTLVTCLWPQSATNKLWRDLLLVFAGSLLLTLSSKLSIPFYPVPLTMQTFVVLSVSMVLGRRLAVMMVLLYLLEGAFGLPVFAGTPQKGLGISYMLGPTGGYLLGFLPAAYICGYLAEKGWDKNPLKTAFAMFSGNIIIYSFGLLWLGYLLGWDERVLPYGLFPFIYGDILKIGLATLILPFCWKKIGKNEVDKNKIDKSES